MEYGGSATKFDKMGLVEGGKARRRRALAAQEVERMLKWIPPTFKLWLCVTSPWLRFYNTAEVIHIAVCRKYWEGTSFIEVNTMSTLVTHTIPKKNDGNKVVKRQRAYDYLYGK